jgi:hypothetical protein
MTESTSDFVIQFDQAEVNTNHKPAQSHGQIDHEMAQPMGAIESIAYYLRMVLPKEDQRTQRHLERIEELVACVNGTLSDAVQYLRQASSEPEEIDLHTLIADALAERPQDSAPVFSSANARCARGHSHGREPGPSLDPEHVQFVSWAFEPLRSGPYSHVDRGVDGHARVYGRAPQCDARRGGGDVRTLR